MTKEFVLDRELILDRLGGDEEIFFMMIDMYLQDAASYAQALAAAFESADVDLLMREAHTIKGLLATFSDDAGAADAFIIEQQARLVDLSGLQPAVAALQRRILVVADVLRAEVRLVG